MRNLNLSRLVGNILDTDGYKFSHWLQDPPNTTESGFYLSSRGGKFDKTVFFGLQRLLNEELAEPITLDQINYASEKLPAYGTPFNREGWLKILERHNGYMPVKIRAPKEGSIIPANNILLDVRSTDPELSWAAGYVETQAVRQWYPISVATKSYEAKKIIFKYLELTSDSPLAELPYKLHDFGGRAVTCREQAGIGGMSHLVNFMGTDTYMGVLYADNFYGPDANTASPTQAGCSIPAAEHSTACKWGRARQGDFYRHMFKAFGRKGAVWACVSDTYDYFDVVENMWGGELAAEIEASGSTVVIRPDSGVPLDIILKSLKILERKVGMTVNSKGYKVLPSWVRLIQGDGVSLEAIDEILGAMMADGYSASNIAFGMGGELLQKGLNRDTNKFAYKCWDAVIDGVVCEIFKDPKTDPGKASFRGRHSLVLENGIYRTLPGELVTNIMEDVWDTGRTLRHQNLGEVRALAGAEFLLAA
jgi:nicotinamide phosphoribosyltransferase